MNLKSPTLLFAALMFFVSMGSLWGQHPSGPLAENERVRLFIDSDAGNDIDDLLAISLALQSDRWTVSGISATLWNLRNPGQSLDSSYVLLDRLRQGMDGVTIPLYRGSRTPFGNPWGGHQWQANAASHALIQEARRSAKDSLPLTVVCLGALTNVATAVAMDPGILPHIRVIALAARREDGHWNKNEFNVRNDLTAFDFLLEEEELEMWILPANVAGQFRLHQNRIDSLFDANHRALLHQRWDELYPKKFEIPVWDLALIMSLLEPQSVHWETLPVPPENGSRNIYVATRIDLLKIRTHPGMR